MGVPRAEQTGRREFDLSQDRLFGNEGSHHGVPMHSQGSARGSEECSVCSSTDQVLSYAFWETELCINDKFSLIPNHQM